MFFYNLLFTCLNNSYKCYRTINNKTTVIVAALVFALVGALVFASVAPYLSEVDAQRNKVRGCGPGSQEANDGDTDNSPPRGPDRKAIPR